ncbi:hypothetical protein N7532_000400 [Penicillium argentinense]|uniref:Uncharacterized protein n=1 Tax=Penicillium argentinense TaxID=1131581 RepID=A0A9W9G633_9EURO|nr:uncharacterized protein N7532_000400 [Penicillium argentinense]KAJ5112355.1 hypothetical protein N7532_000400 [Penicillium argentinense]
MEIRAKEEGISNFLKFHDHAIDHNRNGFAHLDSSSTGIIEAASILQKYPLSCKRCDTRPSPIRILDLVIHIQRPKTIIATSFGFGPLHLNGTIILRDTRRTSMEHVFAARTSRPTLGIAEPPSCHVDNQHQPDAIAEEVINKPWRTMPSGRMSPEYAQTTMLVFYLLALATSLHVSGLAQCITLIGLGFSYSEAKGADASCVVRNLINAVGFICYTSGALQIHLDSAQWIQFTAVDGLEFFLGCGGESGALHWAGVYFALLACLIAGRMLLFRSAEADKKSFVLWNIWLIMFDDDDEEIGRVEEHPSYTSVVSGIDGWRLSHSFMRFM